MTSAKRSNEFWQLVAGTTLGVAGAAAAIPRGWAPGAGVCLCLLAIPAVWWMLGGPNRWLLAFFTAAWLLPPLPFEIGDSGPHVALLFAAAGLLIGVLRASEWTFRVDSLSTLFLLLVAVMLASAVISALYSDVSIAVGSIARVFLFGIAIYSFLYVRYGPFRASSGGSQGLIRVLFWAAVASVIFALVDFYYQFPAPAGYGAQFVWMDTGIFRRAQGLFYEASTLGNLCVFFLDMIAAGFLCVPTALPIKRWKLSCAAVPLLAALVLSYSRASLVSLFCAVMMLGWLRRRQSSLRYWLGGAGAAVLAGYIFLVQLFPTFAYAYLVRLSNTIEFFRESPNAILSGRLHTWQILGEFLIAHPWHAVIGIGYKTLPYTSFIGTPIIADNTYVSTFVETGVVGLALLIAFNVVVLRASYKASRSLDPHRAFYGTWIFCFWVGQVVQMFSADLLTYWRVLPAYLSVLALAVREDDSVSKQ